VFTLLTGNVVAQAIGLLAIPILSRLYTPEEFGAVALFVSIVNILAIASNGRYDMAIVPAKRNGEAFHLMVGSIALSFLFSVLLFLLIFFVKDWFLGFFSNASFKSIIWLVPLLVFFTGSHKSLHYWFNRHKGYNTIATNRVLQAVTQNGIKLGRDVFTNGYWGLVVGTIVGEIVAWGKLVNKIFRTELWRIKYISKKSIYKTLREQLNFPKYLMPMGIINSFSGNILIFTLTSISTVTVVGYYERAMRVISLPFSLLSTSFGNVFYERMTKTSSPLRLYFISYIGNLALALVVLTPILFWGEPIFTFVLGPDWDIAGKIARILVPLTVFNYATACVSNVFSVYKRNQILLVWQALYLIIVLGWIVAAKDLNIFLLIKIYAYLGSALYFLLAVLGFLTVKRSVK
jgi:O-antigen/teichoic acid export membrane protein